MAYTINTNIAGLQAQDYLRITTDFQQKTINRVTSGLRIINSGDDAAGLAIANGFRSDRAVLTQGVRNANDGLSTLQTIDGGINNISQLIDRARTLAAQSASGTLTGTSTRTVLNSEFQSVIGEIDRQAQAIGLDQNGLFAKSLSVFIGGGRENNGVTAISNGSVDVDLSTSTVDAKSLGLKGLQVTGGASGVTDIGNASATSIANIVNNNTNTTSEAVTGFTDFYFRGSGFSDGNRVKVSVNLAGVTDSQTLVSAINSSIASAGNGSSPAATAFKSAGITSSIVTDPSTGRQRLAFTSSTTAFQAGAGDRVSNALLGNFSAESTGVDLSYSVTAGDNVATTGTAWAANSNIIVRVQGGSLTSPVDLTLSSGTSASTVDVALASLSAAVSSNAALQAAGISLTAGTFGSPIAFASKRGETFEVSAAGDTGGTTTQGILGLGKFQLATPGSPSFDYSTLTGTGGAYNVAALADFVFSLGGGTATSVFTITNTTDSTAQSTVDAFNAAFSSNAALQAAGLVATVNGGEIRISSANGTQFRLDQAANTGIDIGFGSAASTSPYAANTNSGIPANSTVDAGGAAATQLLNFSAIRNGSDSQTITVSATNSAGAQRSAFIVLADNGTTENARSLDEAISAINAKLQQTNDPALQKIVAVKEINGGVEKIGFISSNSAFQVSIGTNGGGTGIGSQGTVQSTNVTNGGATADISTQSNAQAAVNALASSVSLLGAAQAVVGKGENAFNFAVNLASTQISNLAAAESRIRDADLAAEAANLTKAQILQQAGIAALAQANSAPQVVLSLLKG